MPIPEERETNIYWCPPDTFYHNNELLAKIDSHQSSKNPGQLRNQSEDVVDKNVGKKSDPKQNYPVAALNYKTEQLTDSPNTFVAETQTNLQSQQANAYDLINNNQKPDWTDLEGSVRDYQMQSLILQSFNKALVLLDQNRELLDLFSAELISREILRKPEISDLLENFVPELFSKSKDKELENNIQEIDSSQLFSLREGTSLIRVVDSRSGSQSRRKQTRWIDFCSLT